MKTTKLQNNFQHETTLEQIEKAKEQINRLQQYVEDYVEKNEYVYTDQRSGEKFKLSDFNDGLANSGLDAEVSLKLYKEHRKTLKNAVSNFIKEEGTKNLIPEIKELERTEYIESKLLILISKVIDIEMKALNMKGILMHDKDYVSLLTNLPFTKEKEESLSDLFNNLVDSYETELEFGYTKLTEEVTTGEFDEFLSIIYDENLDLAIDLGDYDKVGDEKLTLNTANGKEITSQYLTLSDELHSMLVGAEFRGTLNAYSADDGKISIKEYNQIVETFDTNNLDVSFTFGDLPYTRGDEKLILRKDDGSLITSKGRLTFSPELQQALIKQDKGR